ncbi:Wzz/FepE/Etk N-terminal domain-containing protein [Fodinisporobacter ferrooxydans]|uniref:Wzz/FepE/Etk N-terminal domain-containing protein n=1 Tax=Fodinisporobacter ferrooxydans TaxID=2901836 RepID=A0ABY4CFA2_9BACL|nr:Wzz/FepE/Etk N-terminal domain-containing protein [Alicyclobacillaceae bacterium MYW30-H2]
MNNQWPALDVQAKFTISDWLVVAYVILLPIQFRTPIGLRFAPSDVCLLFYFMFGLFRIQIVKSTWSLWHLGMLLVFAIGNYISLLQNGYLSQYVLLEKDFGLLLLFLSYVMIVSFTTDWIRCRRLVQCFILSTVLQNIVAIAAFFLLKITGFNITWLNYESSRLSGMLVDPNAYGGLLVLAFALHIMTSGKTNPIFTRRFGVFCTVSLGIGILLTFSRSAWIGLVTIVLVVALFRPMYVLRIVTVGVFTFGIVLIVLGSRYLPVIESMSLRIKQITARMDYIYTALNRFKDHPIFGVGVGTFQDQYNWILHNTTLWFLAEFGLVGMVTFLGFILWFFYKGMSAYRIADENQKPLVFGFMLGHLSMFGLSLGIEALYQRHWWLIMGLLAASHFLGSKDPLIYSLPIGVRRSTKMDDALDLRQLLKIIRDRIWLILLITIAITLLAGVGGPYLLKPQYQASTEILLNISSPMNGNSQGSVTQSEIASNLMLIETFRTVIKSPRIMEPASKQLGIPINALMKQVSVDNVTNSQVLSIVAKDSNPKEAMRIANTVANIFENQITKLMKVDNVSVLNPANMTKQVWPMPFLTSAIAFVFGLIVSIGGVLSKEYFDTRLRTEQIIVKHLGLPIIGKVPVIDTNLKRTTRKPHGE